MPEDTAEAPAPPDPRPPQATLAECNAGFMESVRNRPGPVAPGTVTEVEVEMPPEKAKQAIAQARRQANEIVSAADTKAMETVEAANAEAAALLEKAGEEARGLVLEEARRIVAENPEEPESETTEE